MNNPFQEKLMQKDLEIQLLKEEIGSLRGQNSFLIKGLKQCTQDIEWGESMSAHIDKIKKIAVETLNNHARS